MKKRLLSEKQQTLLLSLIQLCEQLSFHRFGFFAGDAILPPAFLGGQEPDGSLSVHAVIAEITRAPRIEVPVDVAFAVAAALIFFFVFKRRKQGKDESSDDDLTA